ncbi:MULTISPECIES: ABC transporter substrate-binding protein [Xanthobacter]|uniref:ABC transporter substrate-binding protein n=1 Tax=Xanthobacter TaxID=279 RepID=UPI0035B18370
MKKNILWTVAASCVVAIGATLHVAAAPALETVKIGICTPALTKGVAPFAVAEKMGYLAAEGYRVDLVAAGTATDCAKYVATRQFPYAQFSIEPIVTMRQQGVKMTTFYTHNQGNVYGIAVPEDSPIKSISDLKGKKVGVTSLSSVGVFVARALLQQAGLQPTDFTPVVVGQGAQTAELLRSKQVDALSAYDTQFALVRNAGVPMRELPVPDEFSGMPTTGFVALESVLQANPKTAEAIGRAWAMGTVFAMANPAAAVRMTWEQYPQTKPSGKSDEQALADDLSVLKARLENLKLEKSHVTRWGENNPASYKRYLDFITKWNIVKPGVDASEVFTNAYVAGFNTFDVAKVEAQAKAYR